MMPMALIKNVSTAFFTFFATDRHHARIRAGIFHTALMKATKYANLDMVTRKPYSKPGSLQINSGQPSESPKYARNRKADLHHHQRPGLGFKSVQQPSRIGEQKGNKYPTRIRGIKRKQETADKGGESAKPTHKIQRYSTPNRRVLVPMLCLIVTITFEF